MVIVNRRLPNIYSDKTAISFLTHMHMWVYGEALIVAPPFLDMCLDIYGAWINKKKSFDCDIILYNIAFFAKKGFLKQKLFFVIDQTFTINLLSYTKTLVPLYRFRAITFFMVPRFFWEKMAFLPQNKKNFVVSCFSRSLNYSSSISRYVLGYIWGLD